MTTKLYRALTGTALAFALGTSAYAASPLLDKADINKDGRIALSEFTAHGDQKFAAMDTNADGFVTKDERRAFYQAKRAERAQMRFDKADTNQDGMLSKEEYSGARAKRDDRMKKMLDMNGDGNFDREDRQEIRAERKERRQQRRAKRGERGEHGDRKGPQNPDTNDDGMIDLAEHQSAVAQAFSRLDADGDGYLTGDEQRPPKRRRHKHGGFGQ